MTDGEDDFSITVVEQNPVGLETHGLGANLQLDEYGLSPYWGFVSVFEPDHDDVLEPFQALGETWEVVGSSHWEGKLAPPPGQDFDGGLYEYQYKLEVDDNWGDMDATFQFRPGFPDAKHVDTGKPIGSMPDECPECLRLQSITTNLEPDQVLELLQELADHIGLNPDYFDVTPHESSTAYQVERYGRLDRAVAEDHLTGPSGIIDQLADFASEQRGRGQYKWDHEEIVGHYQAVTFDPDTWAMLIDSQQFGKQLKCYHPAHVRDASTDPSDDPLVNPKIEVSFSPEYDPDSSVPWNGLDSIIDELDESAYNALHWAGVPITPDESVWTSEDPYFDVDTADPVTLVSNPLPDLREATEHHVKSELMRADVTETDLEFVKALTDGGDKHYEVLADDADASTSSVYRFLSKFASFLESDNGIVRFVDDVSRSHVTDIVGQLRDTAEWASESLRDIAARDGPLRGRGDGEPSALEQWMNRHGIRLIQDRSKRLKFELSRRVSEREMQKIIRAGLEAAESSGLHTNRFRNAYITWKDLNGNQYPEWETYVNGRILGQVRENTALW